MSWQTMRLQLANLISGLSTVQEVKSFPTIDFSGYPAVHITPSNNSADYETTTENVRTYAFTVRIFYETKNTGTSDAMGRIEKVVDSILDLIDQEDQKGSDTRTVGISLPSGYQFLNIWAVPASWGELTGENLVLAELTVGIRISRDVT